MAVSHVTFNDQLQHGRLMRRGLQLLEEGIETLNDLKAFLDQAKDGDGSQAAHFTYATAKMGTTSDSQTKALYDELASLLFKLNTDSSVTDVHAAMIQAFAKFR